MNRKCLRNMSHEWETTLEYGTHIVKECARCHVKNWQHRKGAVAVPSHKPSREVMA